MTTELILERGVPDGPEALWHGWTEPALPIALAPGFGRAARTGSFPPGGDGDGA